jgi:hypothetical protein
VVRPAAPFSGAEEARLPLDLEDSPITPCECVVQRLLESQLTLTVLSNVVVKVSDSQFRNFTSLHQISANLKGGRRKTHLAG